MRLASFNAKDTAPNIVEAEQAVLGLLLLNPDTCGIVAAAGGSDLFYDPMHSEMFSLIGPDKERFTG